jgi:hypothetical protein
MVLSCYGESCCPEGNPYGTVWDNTNKQCITPDYVGTSSEGFVGERCLQNTFGKSQFNVNIFKDTTKNIKGYNNNNKNYVTF